MKARLLGLMAVSILFAAPALCIDDDGGLQFFGTVDYYMSAGIEDDVEDDYNALIEFVGNGRSDVSTSNGIGGRLGLRAPVADGRFDIGVSAGYVQGPEIEAEFESFSPAALLQETFESEFIRLMVEAGGRIPISDKVTLRLGAGAGVGQGKTEESAAGSVPGLGTFSGTDEEKSTGFTWEVSPALLIDLGGADLEIGARYAQFPKIKASDDTREVDWMPFGFYVGVAF